MTITADDAIRALAHRKRDAQGKKLPTKARGARSTDSRFRPSREALALTWPELVAIVAAGAPVKAQATTPMTHEVTFATYEGPGTDMVIG